MFQVLVHCAFALGTIEKPAEMAGLKLPGRTGFFTLAFFQIPAVFSFGGFIPALVDQQEVDLPFNMQRNGSPSLLIALDGF